MRGLIHAAGDRSCGIFPMAYILQELDGLPSLRTALRRNLVTDAPHHHCRIAAELTEHVYHILLRPFIEETMVAVPAFGNIPFIERFHHNHHSHLCTQAHKIRSRHIMGSAYGIAAHILEHGYLTAQGRLIDGRTERSEVMVVAHALKLTGLSIEEEPFLGDIF